MGCTFTHQPSFPPPHRRVNTRLPFLETMYDEWGLETHLVRLEHRFLFFRVLSIENEVYPRFLSMRGNFERGMFVVTLRQLPTTSVCTRIYALCLFYCCVRCVRPHVAAIAVIHSFLALCIRPHVAAIAVSSSVRLQIAAIPATSRLCSPSRCI